MKRILFTTFVVTLQILVGAPAFGKKGNSVSGPYSTFKQQVKAQKAQLHENKKTLKKLREENYRLTKGSKDQEKKVSNLQEKVNKLDGDLKVLGTQVQDLDKTITALKSTGLRETDALIDKLTKHQESVNKQIAKLEDKRNTENSRLTSLQTKLNQNKETVKENDSNIAVLQQQTADLKESYKVQNKFLHRNEKLGKVERKLANQFEEKSKLEGKVEEKQKEIAEIEGKLAILREKNIDAAKSIEEKLEKQLKDKKKSAASLESKLKVANAEVTRLNRKIDDFSKNLDKLLSGGQSSEVPTVTDNTAEKAGEGTGSGGATDPGTQKSQSAI